MSDSVLNQFTQAVEEENSSSGRRFKVGIIGTGWIADTISETNDCAIIALYYGSSCYNTAEFSRLLDEIISDAKELGIETATPDEIALMKARWSDERQKNQSA